MENTTKTYPEIEKEIIEFWNKNKIFQKSIDKNSSENYVFYDGPPFATGLPHYGHILSSVIKDLIPRYFTMRGYRVERRWGWDCHGLPIENLVEKELNISGKKQIEEIGVDKFNEKAREMVLTYANSWKEMVDRIGRWVEFDDSYKTMDTDYMESVWWALKKLWDKDSIYEGRKVLMYCARCETPVSNAEVAMDNTYKDVTDLTLTAKFKIKNPSKNDLPDNSYLLAWTTTPWTLPSNVALAVGYDIEYSLVESNGESYILASELVEKNFKDKEYVAIKKFRGNELVGIEYEPLFLIGKVSDSGQRAWYVTDADFVTTEDGTGIVHTAVVYGEDDYRLGTKIGLPVAPLLDSAGRFNEDAPDFLHGLYFKEAQKLIVSDLTERDLAFATFQYTHSYPHCWRCESPLIYNAISAWFINIEKDKEKFIEQNETINWSPKHLKHGRFLNIVKSAPDWNISRNRYWATALPFWKCEDCDETVCVGSIEELRDKSTNFESVYGGREIDLHRPYIDDVKLECPKCKSQMSRIPEVIDCWVESASMPFAPSHYPFESKEEVELRYPGQFIAEYIAQTRAWFYYMHVLGVLLFDKTSYENVVCTGTILTEKGEKMSKSKKNYPDPWEVIDKYGSDALRFYLMGSVVMQAENLFFNEKDLRDSYNKVVNILYNVLNYYKMYPSEKENSENQNILDKWIVSRLENLTMSTTRSLDEYNTVEYCRNIKEFIDELSTWWLRRSRDRFKEDGSASSTLRFVLKKFSKLIAPVVPFVSEHIYRSVKQGDEPESVHLCSWPEVDESKIDTKLEADMVTLRKACENLHNIRKDSGLKVRQPVASVYTNINLAQELIEILKEELNAVEYREPIGEAVSKNDGELTVSLDVKLNDELIKIGDERELTRGFQQARKDAGAKPGEKADAVLSFSIDEGMLSKSTKETFIERTAVNEDLAEGTLVKLSTKNLYIKINREIT